MQVLFQIRFKAFALLVVITTMQLAMVLRALHHHESSCLLKADSHTSQQILHAHADEHDACAWSGFHFSACTVTFQQPFQFLQPPVSACWVVENEAGPQKISFQPSGRAPPSLTV